MRDCIMVVGSGMMGSGIGAMSALAGNRTILVDVMKPTSGPVWKRQWHVLT